MTVCFLLREAYSQSSPPEFLSPASGGIRVSDLDPFESADKPDGAYWLLEPMRYGEVKRYSGTMSHVPRDSSHYALTISAFVHFVYVYSEESLVFADIQGA